MIPRRPPTKIYPDYDSRGPARDHFGLFVGNERNVFVKDVPMPIQVDVKDTKNPIGKGMKKPRFTFR